MRVPVKTVNSRLARGLERLRARWRRAHGEDARSWLAALIRIAGPRHAAAAVHAAEVGSLGTLSLGVFVMSTKLILLGAIALSCGGLVWLWTNREPGPTGDLAQAGAPAEIQVGAHGPTLSVPEALSGSARAPDPRLAEESPVQDDTSARGAEAPAGRRTIRGRVLNAQAFPLSGVDVVFRRANGGALEARTKSGAGGVFELDAPGAAGLVTAEDPALETLLFGSVREHTAIEPLVVVAPFRDLAGRVGDELGRALAGAHVRLVLPDGFAARFNAVFDATEMREWSATADGEGRFELARAPIVEGSRIAAALDGYLESGVEAPLAADRGLEIVLRRPPPDEHAIRGRVEDPQGRPVARARVTLGAQTVPSDENGEFRLSTAGARDAPDLVAIRKGYLPGRVHVERDALSGAPLWPDFAVVRLGGPPLMLAGEVVDREGKPLSGMSVWIFDPTPFGILREETQARVEYLLASDAEVGSDDELERAYHSVHTTDARGEFRIEGLLPRAYALRVLDHKTLGAETFGPYDAGGGDAARVRIVFDPGALGRIAGRLSSRGGHPVENARVALMGAELGGVWKNAGAAITSADGLFAFEGVGRNQIALRITGDDVVSQFRMISEGERNKDLAITVSVRCHFKVDCGAAVDLADTIEMLDERGQSVQISDVSANGEFTGHTFPLVGGGSKVLAVTTDARTLVLSKAGQEVKRVPLDLVPGRLNSIQP
jgi:protocatechuate 3,4-dioxygenase beta subunit